MTTNSPNPVDVDVQALIEKEMDAFEKWFLSYRKDWDEESLYRIKYKNGPGYSSAYVQAMWIGWNAHKDSNPPAQLLRPVELPPLILIGYTQDEMNVMRNVRNLDIEAIRAAGYEVKS